METKGNDLNSLLIMLEGLIHSPAQAQLTPGAPDTYYQLNV